jgi:wyosine [tRNA(Phe)-imidazoG37] synthetase (radical SAM superfamily)
MGCEKMAYSFGPVPSRRLGRSIGVNNIPAKVCSYACRYCQLGPTTRMQVERTPFYDPQEIFEDVLHRVEAARQNKIPVDYLTFVPDGEPSLDVNLGQTIRLLKQIGIPVGVITNSSLIWREDVREDLLAADWVSLKMDFVSEAGWIRVNRPHRSLKLSVLMEGALTFSRSYQGILATETMLIKEEMGDHLALTELSGFLSLLHPGVSYLSIPLRPPGESGVSIPDQDDLNRVFQFLKPRVRNLEYLIGYEGDSFSSTGDVVRDILAITAVHPLRQEALEKMLRQAGSTWEAIEPLLARGDLKASQYRGKTFYLRKMNTLGKAEQ